jgi:hypothetical protein
MAYIGDESVTIGKLLEETADGSGSSRERSLAGAIRTVRRVKQKLEELLESCPDGGVGEMSVAELEAVLGGVDAQANRLDGCWQQAAMALDDLQGATIEADVVRHEDDGEEACGSDTDDQEGGGTVDIEEFVKMETSESS